MCIVMHHPPTKHLSCVSTSNVDIPVVCETYTEFIAIPVGDRSSLTEEVDGDAPFNC